MSSSSKTVQNCSLLYHQTIIPTQNVTHAIEGSFTQPNANDLAIIRHNTLELWTLHAENDTAECIHSCPLFTTVYAAVAVPTCGAALASSAASRSAGVGMESAGVMNSGAGSVLGSSSSASVTMGSTGVRGGVHYLAITSETGYLTLLRYRLREPPVPTRVSLSTGAVLDGSSSGAGGNASDGNATGPTTTVSVITSLQGSFVKVSEVCLGRSGARLTVPGARMAVDAAGEAIFVTALMRGKMIVPIKRTGLDAASLDYTSEDPLISLDKDGGFNSDGEEDNGGVEEGEYDEEDGGDGGRLDRNENGLSNSNLTKFQRRKRAVAQAPAKGVIEFGSPIEALRHTIILSVCALDGFIDSIVFAALEEDLAEVTELQTAATAKSASTTTGEAFLKQEPQQQQQHRKYLVVYAYSPSLHQVQRTHLVHLPASAHRLISVPGAPCGPAGVLVCTDADIIWYDLSEQQQQYKSNGGGVAGGGGAAAGAGVFKCTSPLPRRLDYAKSLYDPSIIAHATTRVAKDFFLLLQDEHGDVMRVFLPLSAVLKAYSDLKTQQQQQQKQQQNADGSMAPPAVPVHVTNPLAVHYFDSIPPCTSMTLFRKGYLFAGTEAGPLHGLYKIHRDGYKSEAEYIVKHIKRIRAAPAAAAAATAEIKSEDRKRGREEDEGSAEKKMAMPMPMAPPSSLPGVAASAGTIMAGPPARIIAVYQPHMKPRHMALIRSYPNTPSILSFTTTIPGMEDDESSKTAAAVLGGGEGADDGEAENVHRGNNTSSTSIQQQPQVQVNAVAGRGADSSLIQARYGYATRRDGSFPLPAVFTSIIALTSAVELRRVIKEQREAIAAATAAEKIWRSTRHRNNNSGSNSGGGARSVEEQARARTLRQLAAAASNSVVGTDKVMLSTRQGTSVFRVGEKVMLDTGTGFVTNERTLVACTLKHGAGYVQVTPRGIYVLGAEPAAAAASMDVVASAVPTQWAHPHGKAVIAAAATPTSVLLSFGVSGGVASFGFGLSGTHLEQTDVLPTFPTAVAVALLQPPVSAIQSAVQSELNALLFNGSGAGGAATAESRGEDLELAALATEACEVYVVRPKKLREPLVKINCAQQDTDGSSSSNHHHHNNNSRITSLLLTYLGSTSSRAQRRLFCFIGHSDGMLTLCELDTRTMTVKETVTVSCGSAGCQLIPGDGETVCYVQSGQHSWRCEVQDGVAKVVPWRFPESQTAFSRFVAPGASARGSQQKQQETKIEIKQENTSSPDGQTEEEEAEEGISLVSVDMRDELVLAIRDRRLSLFAAQHTGSRGASALAYSFSAHNLPVAGRMIVRHPTRSSYYVIASTEHRGYGVEDVLRQRSEEGTIPLDGPLRSLGKANVYTSSLQVFNEATGRLLPPYYLPAGDSIRCLTIGTFAVDFGKEPVVVLGAASQYTHGAGCNRGARWDKGWIRTFRFQMKAATTHAPAVLYLQPLHQTLIRAAKETISGEPEAFDYPSALHICEDVGLLFAGFGKEGGLRIYVWGQHQLLYKRGLPNVPDRIIAIETIFVPPPAGVVSAASASSPSSSSSGGGSSLYSAPDLYRRPTRRARENQLLIVCGTVSQSVFIASLQPGSAVSATSPSGTPSFLIQVARDSIPRSLTSIAVLDTRTIAVADRFGTVAFLRIPDTTRFKFSEPLHQISNPLECAAIEKFFAKEQLLEEVACHQVGQLVTALHAQRYDPSGGTDASLDMKVLYYATALGAVGAFSPFVTEEDGALAEYLRPILSSHMRLLLAPGRSGQLPYTIQSGSSGLMASPAPFPSHHVVEGDMLQLYRQATATVFTPAGKAAVEEEVERARRMEAARRSVLGLPARELPLISELVAKQRALATLPM